MEFLHATEDIHNQKAFETFESARSTITDFDVLSIKEHIEGQDAAKELLEPQLKLDYNEIKNTGAAISQVPQFPQHDSSNVSTQKKLGKSPTFPCSNKENASLKDLFAGKGHSSTVLAEGSSSADGGCDKNTDSASEKNNGATCQRSLSFPSTIKVVSALKGGREKQGQAPREKLSVKWAPDVYDPPVTSASHTVKNHQQRPKTKKDKYRKRHKNGKSNRGNTNEKKQANRSTTISSEPPSSRIQAPIDDDRLPPGSSMRCGVDVAEYAAHCHEPMSCGCFLAGSLAKIQSPVAEAS